VLAAFLQTLKETGYSAGDPRAVLIDGPAAIAQNRHGPIQDR